MAQSDLLCIMCPALHIALIHPILFRISDIILNGSNSGPGKGFVRVAPWSALQSAPTGMNRSHVIVALLAFVAFVAIGMPDGLLGVAWPSIRRSFSVPLDAAGLLLSAAVIGGLVSSISSGPAVARFGVGNILAWSCALTGAGLIGYTLVPFWWMMILLGAVAGLGAGAIDSGLNTYAAANFSEGRMQWLHACYGIGITLGPIIMTGALTFTNSWRIGYRIVGGVQIALSIWFLLMRQEWNRGRGNRSSRPRSRRRLAKHCDSHACG
jgi:MFS family permease